jgi:hypothetical protein
MEERAKRADHQRVVITGMGAITPVGHTAPETWRALKEGRSGIGPLTLLEGDWAYHDSYFGESDFLGQEIVYYQMIPVWGMNYYGRLLRPDLATAEQMGRMIMTSLSKMYEENRFLGGFEHIEGRFKYIDSSDGEVSAFQGTESIYLNDELVYRLVYHGGLIQY